MKTVIIEVHSWAGFSVARGRNYRAIVLGFISVVLSKESMISSLAQMARHAGPDDKQRNLF